MSLPMFGYPLVIRDASLRSPTGGPSPFTRPTPPDTSFLCPSGHSSEDVSDPSLLPDLRHRPSSRSAGRGRPGPQTPRAPSPSGCPPGTALRDNRVSSLPLPPSLRLTTLRHPPGSSPSPPGPTKSSPPLSCLTLGVVYFPSGDPSTESHDLDRSRDRSLGESHTSRPRNWGSSVHGRPPVTRPTPQKREEGDTTEERRPGGRGEGQGRDRTAHNETGSWKECSVRIGRSRGGGFATTGRTKGGSSPVRV